MRRHAAGDVLPLDEQHQHVVHAVPVQAFRRRPSLLAGARLDPELMHLDVPRPRAGARLLKRLWQNARIVCRRRAGPDLVGDRREPSLDPAVQRVVVDRLKVGLMRLRRG